MKNIVLMHGILGDERTWQSAFEYLPDEFKTHSYTMNGFSNNPDLEAEIFNTETHAAELIEYCKSNFEDKVCVMAWSYSCHVALLAALRTPELFDTIYLYDCIAPSYGLENDPIQMKAFSKDLTTMMSPVIKAIRGDKSADIVNAFTLACSEQSIEIFDQKPMVQKIKMANAHTVSRLLTQQEPQPITLKDLEKLMVPCGIYWGELSRPIFQIASSKLLENLPKNIKIQNSGKVPNMHHLSPEDNPKALIEHIFKN